MVEPLGALMKLFRVAVRDPAFGVYPTMRNKPEAVLSNLSHVGFVVFLLMDEVLAYCDGRDFFVLVLMKVYDVRSESMQAFVMIACQKSDLGKGGPIYKGCTAGIGNRPGAC